MNELLKLNRVPADKTGMGVPCTEILIRTARDDDDESTKTAIKALNELAEAMGAEFMDSAIDVDGVLYDYYGKIHG